MSGFPSPAKDYVETRLSVASICNIDANCLVIETSRGYAVVDKSMLPRPPDFQSLVLSNFLIVQPLEPLGRG